MRTETSAHRTVVNERDYYYKPCPACDSKDVMCEMISDTHDIYCIECDSNAEVEFTVCYYHCCGHQESYLPDTKNGWVCTKCYIPF